MAWRMTKISLLDKYGYRASRQLRSSLLKIVAIGMRSTSPHLEDPTLGAEVNPLRV